MRDVESVSQRLRRPPGTAQGRKTGQRAPPRAGARRGAARSPRATHPLSPAQVATGFAATLTLAATLAALLARAHALRHAADPPAAAARGARARRRLIASCAACIYVAEFFAVIMTAACAASWAVGHTVQLGVSSTASGDNTDFAAAVSEALVQTQTKLGERMATSTEAAYQNLLGSGLGSVLKAPAATFRDTVVRSAVKLANETAAAAVVRANSKLAEAPPPRPARCANKFCAWIPMQPLFEAGDGLCICTFAYLADAATAATRARSDVLLAFVGEGRGTGGCGGGEGTGRLPRIHTHLSPLLSGAILMFGGFGALLQRVSYWLGRTAAAVPTPATRASGLPPPPGGLQLTAKAASLGVGGGVPPALTPPDSPALGRAEAALGPAPPPRRAPWWKRRP